MERMIRLMSGGGLSINEQHVYCGDYIYSGHTMTLVMTFLIIKECKWTDKAIDGRMES